MDKRIIVAVDGSVYSANSLDYLIRLFGRDTSLHVHLLSVISASSSDHNWMLDVDPHRQQSPLVERKTNKALSYLKEAKARLVRGGFAGEQVSFATEAASSTIAAAIHHRATQGVYDGLLIGRRGVGMVGEMFFGSVSAELINRCHDVPLWVIDGEVTAPNFLLGVHCMLESLIAADHLAYIINTSPAARVYLYHSASLLRSNPKIIREDFEMLWGEKWCAEHLDLDNHLFNAHTRILLDNGVTLEQIQRLPTQAGLDPSHDLLGQAKKHRCGTIVLGRRGREAAKGILKGVSERAMYQAQNVAIWLVG